MNKSPQEDQGGASDGDEALDFPKFIEKFAISNGKRIREFVYK